ncbi:MAG: dihydroneopterin aldolase, partial [Verrucomicrobiota bacterium]
MRKNKISIVDLEVFYRVGVPEAERAQPQRLLLTLELESDFSAAAKRDGIADTHIDLDDDVLDLGEDVQFETAEASLAEPHPMAASDVTGDAPRRDRVVVLGR